MDLRQGTIRILHSKGHKDRLIYMPEDLIELLRTYEKVLYGKYHCLSEWFFPAREPERCLSNCTIDKKFREFWALTPYAEYCDKAPTVRKGQILRSTPNTAPLICGACNTQPEGLSTMA